MQEHKIHSFLSILFFFCATILVAQPKLNNPYSRYGLGEFAPQSFATQLGMGGLGAALHDPFQLNPVNPAASAWLGATAFEVGLNAKRSVFESSAGDQLTQLSGNLAYFNLGMTLKSPINRALDKVQSPWHYGMSVGVSPFTSVGYNITTRDTLPDLGDIRSQYEGSGGTYKLNWSGSARKNQTSFGLGLGWAFGKNTYKTTTQFVDSLSTFQDNFRDAIRIKGLTWRLGVQHDYVLSRDDSEEKVPTKWLTIGFYGSSNQNLTSVAESYRIRSRGQLSNGTFVTPDTLVYTPDTDYNLRLPAEFGFGLTYEKAKQLRLGAEFTYGAWEKYKNDARPERFQNTFSVAAGAEITPNDNLSYKNYWKRIRYRFGGYYRKDPRIVNGQGVEDVGVTFGLGMPILLPRQQTSFVNTSFELGRLGAGTAISETYFRLTVGFTMNDNTWFYKRRFE